MTEQRTPDVRQAVRDRYASIAQREGSCCGPGASTTAANAADPAATRSDGGCGCGPAAVDMPDARTISEGIGYTDDQMAAVPESANLGLGCGNPTALADLSPGETVLDLGSGGGIDCFIASRAVGPEGRVIGVDMTPAMVDRARAGAASGNYDNVEFRLGEIEHLPVADGTVDAIISNCVVNLSPDKPGVFREAFRVLQPGGRMTVSDIVLDQDLPQSILDSIDAYVGCIAGAVTREAYLEAIAAAGFETVEIVSEKGFEIDADTWADELEAASTALGIDQEQVRSAAGSVVSVTVKATKL